MLTLFLAISGGLSWKEARKSEATLMVAKSLSCSVAPSLFFLLFFGGCPAAPLKMVFPRKGSLLFQGH